LIDTFSKSFPLFFTGCKLRPPDTGIEATARIKYEEVIFMIVPFIKRKEIFFVIHNSLKISGCIGPSPIVELGFATPKSEGGCFIDSRGVAGGPDYRYIQAVPEKWHKVLQHHIFATICRRVTQFSTKNVQKEIAYMTKTRPYKFSTTLLGLCVSSFKRRVSFGVT